jgi:hypothetical protein
MTCSEAVILTGDKKSLIEVRRQRDQILDSQRFDSFVGLSDSYVD